MTTVKLLLSQLNSINGPKQNEKKMKEALEEDFDVAIFPELFYSGYLRRDSIYFYQLDLEFLKYLKENIGKRMLIFGSPFRDQFLYNSAVLIYDGEMMMYYKMHLPNFGPFEEARYFSRGKLPLAIDHKGIRFNIQICYDIFFNDSYVKGSDIIVNISASPFTSRSFFEKVFQAKAIENQAFFIYVNTAGLQRNQVFWGGSRVVDPDGKEIFRMAYFNEYASKFTINMERLENSRQKRRVLDEVLHESKE